MSDPGKLSPQEQLQALIASQPKVYRCKKCGGCTEMSVVYIQIYVMDPYSDWPLDQTVCATCNKGYHHRQFDWAETGENMDLYFRRLRAEVSLKAKLFRFFLMPSAGAIVGLWLGWVLSSDWWGATLGTILGAFFAYLVVGLMPARFHK